MSEDPIARLCEKLDDRAASLRDRCTRPGLTRPLRARIRENLTLVFRLVEGSPAPGGGTRKAWAKTARALLGELERLRKQVDRQDRPPAAMYSGDRLGVIRRMEPVRIRFAVGRLGRAERFERFEMLSRLRPRLAWLWKRIDEHCPAAHGVAREETDWDTGREGTELIWGRAKQ